MTIHITKQGLFPFNALVWLNLFVAFNKDLSKKKHCFAEQGSVSQEILDFGIDLYVYLHVTILPRLRCISQSSVNLNLNWRELAYCMVKIHFF